MKKIFFLLVIHFLFWSCARVGSPNGGSKDSLAPKFLASNIDSNRVNVSKNLKELRIDFDEYIQLKEINKNLIISPPIKKIKKIIPSNLANKYLLIQWEDTLKANTTYNFNFGNAIVDNNEGNVLPYYNFAFSTGEKLDSLYVSGTVTDALSVAKKTTDGKDKNIVVGLYEATPLQNFKEKPYYITKVDEENYFELNYISAGKYHIIAFEDENQNSQYDFGKEKISFQKEELNIEKSVSGLQLKLFPSKKTVKYQEMKSISGGILMLFEGNPNQVKVNSLADELKDYQVTHQAKSDSAYVWFNPKNNNIKTETGTQLKFAYEADTLKKETSLFYKVNPKDELVITNNKGNLLSPKQPFRILANMPINKIKTDGWKLESDSTSVDFSAKISAENNRYVEISADYKAAKKYKLSVSKESVFSYYENNTKAYQFDFEADKPENYGVFTLKLLNKPNVYFWVQLINEKDEVQYQQYVNRSEINFDTIKSGVYYVRLLVDENGNKHWDEADFSQKILSEEAYVFPKKIEARPMWEIVEQWDLKTNESASALNRN